MEDFGVMDDVLGILHTDADSYAVLWYYSMQLLNVIVLHWSWLYRQQKFDNYLSS